jgi:hypothetical protein
MNYPINTQYFTITIDLNNDIIDKSSLQEGWLNLLENIYGVKTSNYDGYVDKIFFEEKMSLLKIHIDCYIINNEKFYKLKENNPDNWEEIQNNLLTNVIKNYNKIKEYQILNIEINKKLF